MQEKYSVKQAAQILNVSKDTIYNKIKKAQLTHLKENGKLFVLLQKDEALMQKEDEILSKKLSKLEDENKKLKLKIKKLEEKISNKKEKKQDNYIKFSKFCKKNSITKEKQKIFKDKLSKNFKNLDYVKIQDGKFFIKKDLDINILKAL